MHSRTLFALALIGLALIRTAVAADDPIASLRQIMRDNSNLEDQAIALLGGTFQPDKAIAAMQKLQANFTLLPTLVPAAGATGASSPTVLAISANVDGFKQLAAIMVQRAAAAEAAAPNGQRAFAQAFLTADNTCTECHKTYDRH